jgi:hypothetical protein
MKNWERASWVVTVITGIVSLIQLAITLFDKVTPEWHRPVIWAVITLALATISFLIRRGVFGRGESWSYDFNKASNEGMDYGHWVKSAVEGNAKYAAAETTSATPRTQYQILISGKSIQSPASKWSTAYFVIAKPRWFIQRGDVLRYSIWYFNSTGGTPIGIDLIFDMDGDKRDKAMRDENFTDQMHKNVHPCNRDGYQTGQWTEFWIDLSKRAGSRIDEIQLAYDNGDGKGGATKHGSFSACVDKIELVRQKKNNSL